MALDSVSGLPLGVHTLGIEPKVSIQALSAAGPGAALDAGTVRTGAVLVVTASSGTTGGSVALQGSLDAVSWFNLGSAVTTSAAGTTQLVESSAYARYFRANIASAITGGGSVTAVVGATG